MLDLMIRVPRVWTWRPPVVIQVLKFKRIQTCQKNSPMFNKFTTNFQPLKLKIPDRWVFLMTSNPAPHPGSQLSRMRAIPGNNRIKKLGRQEFSSNAIAPSHPPWWHGSGIYWEVWEVANTKLGALDLQHWTLAQAITLKQKHRFASNLSCLDYCWKRGVGMWASILVVKKQPKWSKMHAKRSKHMIDPHPVWFLQHIAPPKRFVHKSSHSCG